jgi:DNA invertase Pin-like site-specific DNA recombinase
MRIAIYARVSTADQLPEQQIRELRSYAPARHWQIVREAGEVGGKGSNERPEREDILNKAKGKALGRPRAASSRV